MDEWFYDEDYSRSNSSSEILPESLFDTCSGYFSGCVPELDLNCLELGDSELMNSTTGQICQQVYQTNMQLDIRQLITKDSINHSQWEECFASNGNQPSSSSSSLGSHGSSDCLPSLNNSRAWFIPDSETTFKRATQLERSQVLPHQVTMLACTEECNTRFPGTGSDDMALTRAMVAVISAGSIPPPSSASLPDQPPQHAQTHQRPSKGRWGAFKPYSSFLAPKFESKHYLCSQKMIKKAIFMLREVNRVRAEAPAPANQLHHTISERRRRQKLSGSFHALRLLLPPGSKKDKASVLVNTKNYLNNLKAQISQLEEENRLLEMQLPPTDGARKEINGSSDRVKVQIVKVPKSASGVQQINLIIEMMAECDGIQLALHLLQCLKEMRAINLISMDASTYLPWMSLYARATLTLQLEAMDLDEEWFRTVIAKAVDDLAHHETAIARSTPKVRLPMSSGQFYRVLWH